MLLQQYDDNLSEHDTISSHEDDTLSQPPSPPTPVTPVMQANIIPAMVQPATPAATPVNRTYGRTNAGVPPSYLVQNFHLPDFKSLVASPILEPQTYRQVLGLPTAERDKWLAAIQRELDSLTSKNVFAPCGPLPPTTTTVNLKLVNHVKYKPDNTVDRYKSRICAIGYTQIPGRDYDQTFSPTVRIESVRLLAAI
jgi:hypothetical protein